MREVLKEEQQLVSGGVSLGGGFGYGSIPGFGDGGGPKGLTYDKSFNSGWSLSAGFAKGGARGLEARYVWK